MKALLQFTVAITGLLLGALLSSIPCLLILFLGPGLARAGPSTLILSVVVLVSATIAGAITGSRLGGKLFYWWRGW